MPEKKLEEKITPLINLPHKIKVTTTTSELQKNINDFIENEIINKLNDLIISFEHYRIKFKKNKEILINKDNYKNMSDNDKEETKIIVNEVDKFKKQNKEFNRILDAFPESLKMERFSDDQGKYDLEILIYFQMIQTKTSRVNGRLQEIKITRAERKIIKSERKIIKSEKKVTDSLKTTQKMELNLRNVYSGVLTILGVFLSVFTLISVNINFFGNIAKNVLDTPGYLDDLIKILVMINAITIISVTFLVSLSSKFIFSATQTEIENSNRCFVTILVFAFLFLMISLLCLHY